MNTFLNVIISPFVLPLPYLTGHTTVNTRASVAKVGCVFFQQQLKTITKPIEYLSRSLSEAEKIDELTLRKCFTIVWLELLSRPYLEGREVTTGLEYDSLN